MLLLPSISTSRSEGASSSLVRKESRPCPIGCFLAMSKYSVFFIRWVIWYEWEPVDLQKHGAVCDCNGLLSTREINVEGTSTPFLCPQHRRPYIVSAVLLQILFSHNNEIDKESILVLPRVSRINKAKVVYGMSQVPEWKRVENVGRRVYFFQINCLARVSKR